MTDTIETLRNSLVQHGSHSDRIYLMKLADEDMPGLLEDLALLAAERGYAKIFAKVPVRHLDAFEAQGYVNEALVPKFYRGEEDGVFVSRFLDEDRRIMQHGNEHLNNLALAERKWGAGIPENTSAPRDLGRLGPDDAEEMSRIYTEVFPTYPFPIHDPAYLRETMAGHVAYYGVRRGGRLIALASAEMDPGALNVEMTDFATLPAALGRGCALWLLRRMEGDMLARGFRCSYTIARSESPGMNITFAKLGYVHAGTLVNNTNISGRVESMNVWYRQLASST